MIVKVAPLGERVVEVNVESGTSVGDVLGIASVSVNGRTIHVDNNASDEGTAVVNEGAVITLTNKMKGGSVV